MAGNSIPPKDPKCPGCGSQPLQFACNLISTHMGDIVAMVWCGECGHTLSANFVGKQQNPFVDKRIVTPS